MFLYGKNSVLERLKVKPQSIKNIFLKENFKDTCINDFANSLGITIKIVSEKTLHKIKPAQNLQGIIAEVDKFDYTDFENLINRFKKDKNHSLIFLDSIYDPVNLGAIIRTSACFGNFSLIIPKHRACEVTETVLHIAEGGENFISIAKITNLSQSLREAKKAGYWIVGASAQGGENTSKFVFPVALVLGSEGKGIRYGVEKELDFKLTIPMQGAKLSLNVAQSAAILCYEIAKQRGKNY